MKPILFNTDMVRAILGGRKTVTRRVIKGYAVEHLEIDTDGSIIGVYDQYGGSVRPVMDFAPYRPGDILYVRETWARSMAGTYLYKATDTPIILDRWRPSIHMPKEAARLFLRVTDVRVERLQDITSGQIDAEGCKEWAYSAKTGELLPSGPSFFQIKWDRTIKPSDLPLYGWDANPWVWVIEFERVSKEEALKGGEG